MWAVVGERAASLPLTPPRMSVYLRPRSSLLKTRSRVFLASYPPLFPAAGCNIGPEGVAALAAALMGNSTLTTLDLDANPMGDAGLSTLADALKRSTTLGALSVASAGEKKKFPASPLSTGTLISPPAPERHA